MIDDISLTTFMCTRPAPAITTRKFLSDCGEKIVARISNGKLLDIEPEDDFHQRCMLCKIKTAFVKKLIASGK
jgi:hypothetical protein